MLNSLISATTIIFLFLFPIFYLPVTSESYEYNKMALLLVTDLVLLILISLKFAREKKIYLVKSTFLLPLFLIATISLISALFISPNLLVAAATPSSVTALISGFILYLLFTYIFSFNLIQLHQIITIFIFDAILISLYTILSYLNILPQTSFTPAGNLLATAMFLSVISVYLLSQIISNWLLAIRGKNISLSPNSPITNYQLPIILIFSFILITGTTVFLTYQLLIISKPIILPFAYGWAIALEILKNIKTALLGVGPANFITAFVVAKPLAFNSTPYWNVIFTSSSSFFLNLVTETGVVAGFFYLVLLLKSLKLLKSPITNYQLPITLLFSLLLPLFLPSSVIIFILTVVLLAICSTVICSTVEKASPPSFERPGLSKLISGIPLVFSLVLAGLVIYFGGKIYLADVYFKNSLNALVNNKPQETYNLQKKALELAPAMDRYHLVFSQTNLALAQSIAAKKELTDEDKQYLPRLVYQAIDHSRTAVNLYRTNIFNWDNLAKTYTALINYATGADEWAIASYRQKIALDPLSPSNHLALGNVYKLLNKFDLAAEEFKNAIKLKPDLANAHYQLGLVLKAGNKTKEANEEFQITLSLLAPDTSEAETVRKEVDTSIEN